jgi:hypothetical protein
LKAAKIGFVCFFVTITILGIGIFPQARALTLDNAQTASAWKSVGSDIFSAQIEPVLASSFYTGNTVYLYYTVEDSRTVNNSQKEFLSNDIYFTLTNPNGSITDNFLTRTLAFSNSTEIPATDSSSSKTIESAYLEVKNVTADAQNGEWVISGYYEDKPLFSQQFTIDTTQTATPNPTYDFYTMEPTTDNNNYATLTGLTILVILAILVVLTIIVIRKRKSLVKQGP